jgi:hypothetical protein
MLHQHKSILMMDLSPLLFPKALRSLTPLLETFTLQLHMFRTILLGHLFIRECRPLLAKYTRLDGNHHLVDLSLLEDHHPMVDLPLTGDNPLSCSSSRETSLCQSYPGRSSTTGRGETFVYWKSFTILGSIFWRHIYPTPYWGALIS